MTTEFGSSVLESVIQREELRVVEYYCFHDEAIARKVYYSMLRGDVCLPMKCAVALRRNLLRAPFPYWVVMYMGRTYRIPELPKRLNESWSWNEYLERVGLPPQDEWDESHPKDENKFRSDEESTALVDFFLSPSLKNGKYQCLVCDASFDDYNELFDKHVYMISGHDEWFNASIIKRLPSEVVLEASSLEEAKRKVVEALPSGATILSEQVIRRASKRGTAEGRDPSSKEKALERARRQVPRRAEVIQKTVVQEGRTGTTRIEVDADVVRDADVAAEMRDRFGGTLPDGFEIVESLCNQAASGGFLGFGRKPAVYSLSWRHPWKMALTYEVRAPVAVRVRFHPSRQGTDSSA